MSKKTGKTPAEPPTEGITELTVTRTPESVAAEICALKSQTQTIILHATVEIGRRLTEVKAMLPHGVWGNWLKAYVDYSHDTANKIMKVYEEYKDKLNSETFLNLTYSKAIALLGIPAEEREQFAKDNDIENMSTRELKKAIKEKEELEKLLEIARNIATEKSEESRKTKEEKQQLESDLRVSDKCLHDVQGHVKDLQAALQEEKKNSKEKAEKLQSTIAETKKQLNEAQASGNEALVTHLQESLEKTDNELHVALEKIEELEKQLREKPIETTAAEIIEKVPEEVERELNELRQRVQEFETKPESNEAIFLYKLHFDQVVKGFNDLINDLEKIRKTDQESYKKRKNAAFMLISKMTDRLQ